MEAAVPEVFEKTDHSAQPDEGAKGEAAQDLRIVTFSLGKRAYGIDIMQVKEISSAQRFTYVPNTAAYVRGVFNLRGEIIPIIDMRLFFDLEITGEKSELDITRNNTIYEDLIILTLDYVNIGVIVDHIDHVIGIERRMIQRSHPLFWEMDVPYVDGIVEYKNQLYIILAMDKILDPQMDAGESSSFDLSAALANMADIPKVADCKAPDHKPKKVEKSVAAPAAKQNLLESSPPPVEEAPASVADSPQNEAVLQAEPENVADEDRSVSAYSDPAENSDLVELNENQKLLARFLVEDGFQVTPVNANAVEQKWRAWCKSKNVDVLDEQALRSDQNRRALLALMVSDCHNGYWSEHFRQAVERHFQEHTGNLNVWHAGCGSGRETYSLTAALAGVASEANLQVRAADSELLEVSEAPMQSVKAPSELPQWLREYLNEERGSDGYIFAKPLRDRIIFEYQDVIHATPHARLDLVVIRDLLSRHTQEEQEYVLKTISGALKENGLIVVGDNESLDAEIWELLESVPLKIYRKRRV